MTAQQDRMREALTVTGHPAKCACPVHAATPTPVAELPAFGLLPRGSTPAAWWYSDDAEVIAASNRYETDHSAWWDAFRAFAKKYDADPTTASTFETYDQLQLRGLYPLDVNRIPEGWRFDRAKSRMVPLRKTSDDRGSASNIEMQALARVPFLPAYIKSMGMPLKLRLAHDGGGSIYFTDLRRLPGSDVVVAFQGADPDRLNPAGRHFVVDAKRWNRLPLSTFHAVRDSQGGDES